jgi:ketosteroid isomerase-like protein
MHGISNRTWHELHHLYAEDAVVEYPFALPAPTRLEGRDAIQRYFAGVAQAPLHLQTRNFVVHETSDPEVVIAEWEYDGLVMSTGRSFRVSNIQVSRVRDRRIVASRDYHNHVMLAEVNGRLPGLIAALTNAEHPA